MTIQRDFSMSYKILVFIPCYNCAPQIGRVLRQFDSKTGAYFSEILVLDNGSQDGTVEAAAEAAPDAMVPSVVIGKNKDNYNLGGSHKCAFAYAVEHDFSHVVVLHGDDQGDIHDILPILKNGLSEKCDAYLGSRFAQGSSLQGYSQFRIVSNHLMNFVFSLASGRRVLDLGSGLNLFGLKILEDPALERFADDLRFNNFLLLRLIDSGRRIKFFPISWREDDQTTNVKLVSQTMETFAVVINYIFQRERFRRHDYRKTKRDCYEFDTMHIIIPSAD